ncbi:hypothetical protein [Paenarthrobacter sp. TA1.8]|uniref:hypothetical protein n=1 Tax=Paenarthrobacter sp. TA1.8 TaxID=3400219 RepID=UPI003B42F647
MHAAATELAEVDVVAAVYAGEQWVAGETGCSRWESFTGEGVIAVVQPVFDDFQQPAASGQ